MKCLCSERHTTYASEVFTYLFLRFFLVCKVADCVGNSVLCAKTPTREMVNLSKRVNHY